MKTPIYTRLICCWLAVLVLVSSMGFGVIEHWCEMQGRTQTLLLTNSESCTKDCPAGMTTDPAPGKGGISATPCCKETLHHIHVDVSRTALDDGVQMPAPLIAWLPTIPVLRLLAALLPAELAFRPVPLIDDPLCSTGRFRLTLLCSWLV